MSDDEVLEDEGKKGKKGKKDKGDKEKGGKSNLVPAIVLAVGMMGAAYMLGPGAGSSGEDAAHAEEETTTTVEAVPGEITTVEPININLADGHFVRIGMALQLAEGVLAEEFAAGKTAKANDIIISEIGGRPMSELSTPEGRARLKEDLKERIKAAYEEEETGPQVLDIYFTDFVMQ